ncbi:MAG: Ig-like domain-containing protein, partial [Anaeromyxobacteraceae bacterium]
LFSTTSDPAATTDLVANLPAPAATLPNGALRPDGSARLHVCDALPEVATITVSAPGASPAIGSATQDLTWQLGPVDAAKSSAAASFSIDHPTLVAWSGLGHVTLRPLSACGNPIGAGQPVTFGLAGPGTLTPTVDAGDTYSTTLNVTPCPASGSTQVTARVGTVELTPLPVTVSCVAPDTALSTVSFSRQDVEMCNDKAKDQVTVTVTPRDIHGAPLGPGNTLALSMAGLSGGAAHDAGDGSYTATFSATTCGPAARAATVALDGVNLATVPLTFSCSPVVAGSSGVTVTGKAVADGVALLTVTVAATNGCGEPAPGRPVALASTLGTLASASGTTDAAGIFITTATASAPGQGTVSATVDGVALAPAALSFDPKPAKGGCGTGGDGGLLALLGLAEAVRRRRRGVSGAR